MQLPKMILFVFLASTFLISCGDSAEKKEDDKNAQIEMKETDSKTMDKTSEPESEDSNEISDEAITKVMKELLIEIAAGQVPVPEIIDSNAPWIDKIQKLSNDTGVAKKFAELGDSPQEILKKVKEMAVASEK